jgi:hypothetical protein
MSIDYWKLTREFSVGDQVQRYAPGQGGLSLSPFLGRVTAVHRGLGVIDVQWPYANERMFPDDIVKVHPAASNWVPPALLDTTYMTLDTEKARELWASARSSKLWRTIEVAPDFHLTLARLWTKGASEMASYDFLWRKYASQTPDDAIRDEVQKFYRLAMNMAELRVSQHIEKTAAYWVAQNRTYRVTKEEHDAGVPNCPKCGKTMRKTTYKMKEGDRVRLFACPKDLFLLKQTDLLGPGGEPVTWGQPSPPPSQGVTP